MKDIRLNDAGDIAVTEFGDITLTESVKQKILIRLRWIKEEWRLGPDLGFSWFEDVLVKNPNLDNIQQLLREEILEVEGVTDAEVTEVKFNQKERKATFRFTYTVDEETYKEEVTINV